MKTRSMNLIFKPKKPFNEFFLATKVCESDLVPTSISKALQDPKWHATMETEYAALLRNDTWELVPPHSASNVIGSKWVF